jgi:antitoxin component YwqK of YwqJK toxin-antitoxin module
MNPKLLPILFSVFFSVVLTAQTTNTSDTDINKTDEQGHKQGPWIRKYPDGNVQYEGVFRDDHPVGEFKRYYEDKTLMSLMVYSDDGKEALATIYHPNGFIGSKGRYVNQMKEGKWSFYSYFYEGYLINEEYYQKNKRNGPSVMFYPDSIVFEEVTYVNDRKEGEWFQYYPDGKIFLKSHYSDNMLDGSFEVWYENGQIEIAGNYKENFRDGPWLIYNEDGSLRYKMNYELGVTKDKQMDIDATDLMDRLEKNQGRIQDPEKCTYGKEHGKDHSHTGYIPHQYSSVWRGKIIQLFLQDIFHG